MSPIDFLDFRDFLYPASGFQSKQFRLVENRLGLLRETRLVYGARSYCTYLKDEDAVDILESEKSPSLYTLIEAWLERTPFVEHVGGWTWWNHYREAIERMFASDEEGILSNKALDDHGRESARKELDATREHFNTLLDKDKYEAGRVRGERRLSYQALQAALLITLYHDEPILALPYRLLSTLLDIDENLTAWRHRHALMVHRMIGVKMGTGGSAGYHYLRASAERHKIFTDLFNLSTFLIPRHLLPPLPENVRAKLAFAWVPKTTTVTPFTSGNNITSTPMTTTTNNSTISTSTSVTNPHINDPNIPADGKCPFGHSG